MFLYAPLTPVQKERLSLLLDLVRTNVDHYDHSVFKSADGQRMCAAGLAVQHRDYLFPGLGLQFRAPTGEGTLNRCGFELVTLHGCRECVSELELYFGDGSWAAIFGFSTGKNGTQPSASEVAGNISRFMERQECEAKQPEECSPPMALVARN